MIHYIHSFNREHNVGYSDYCIAYKIDDNGDVSYGKAECQRGCLYNKKVMRETAEKVLSEEPKTFNIYNEIEKTLFDILKPGCHTNIPIHDFSRTFLNKVIVSYAWRD